MVLEQGNLQVNFLIESFFLLLLNDSDNSEYLKSINELDLSENCLHVQVLNFKRT